MIGRANERQIRILHVIPSDGLGGVETAAKTMASRTDLRCPVLVMFLNTQADAAKPRQNAIARILQCVRFRPDVVICSLWKSLPTAIAIKLLRPRAKLVFFLHNDIPIHWADALFARIGIRLADAVWADSASTLAARRLPPQKRTRIISFVTERRTCATRRTAQPRFVSWGRLNVQKGFDRAIGLVAILARRGVDVRYDIYGPDDGAQRSLARLIEDDGLQERVLLRGVLDRSAIPATVEQHSFYLQLSRWEGMCMAAVEAMQLGLVPVTTSVGHMGVYVQPEKTGLIVDPENLEAAADAILRAIADEALYERYSIASREYWLNAPVYAEDVCDAASELIDAPRA